MNPARYGYVCAGGSGVISRANIDARRLQTALRLVQLEEAQLFRRSRVRRPANEGREGAHVADIIAPRVLLEAAHAHVFDHACPQRADGLR